VLSSQWTGKLQYCTGKKFKKVHFELTGFGFSGRVCPPDFRQQKCKEKQLTTSKMDQGEVREWHYADSSSGVQKGPVPAIVLLRLLEKGVGVNGQTLVWKAGMDAWQPAANVSSRLSNVRFGTEPLLLCRLSRLHRSSSSIPNSGITLISKARSMVQCCPNCLCTN
jgi:hypothetical protein